MKIQVKSRNGAYQFEAAAHEKVLFAGLSREIGLPYECASGTCGTCKARLVQGSIDDPWPQAPGRKYLKPELGEFLMCQCVARTDLHIEIGAFVHAMDSETPLPSACDGIIRN